MKKSVAVQAKDYDAYGRMIAPVANTAAASKKTVGARAKLTGSKPANPLAKGKAAVKKIPEKAKTKKSTSQSPNRYKCRL